MSKKLKSHSARAARNTLPTRALVTLQDAIWLIDKHDYPNAREKLETLDKQYPHHPEILTALGEVLYEQQDMSAYQDVAEQLVELNPDNPDILLNLAASYAQNLYPVSALHAELLFLDKFPRDTRAEQVRERAQQLQTAVPDILRDAGLTEPNAEQAAILHERSLAFMARGKYKRARSVVDELLALKPDFVPALNNLSNLYFIEGNLTAAADTARQVLTRDTHNVQALSNLTRFMCLQGRLAEAQPLAAQLKTVESDRLDAGIKQVEALAILGDDQGILEIFDRAQKNAQHDMTDSAFLYHVAGVAALRLGDEARARDLWKRALKLAPTFQLARDNLDDLKKPVGERHVPWAFSLREWISEKTIRELVTRLGPATKRNDGAITQAVQRFLRDHPEIRGLIPMLFDRGDPAGRELALRFATSVQDPDLLAALRDFALSMRGPDDMRLQAAQYAMRNNLIPSGEIHFYSKGKWQDVLLLDMEINDEPGTFLKPAAQDLYEQAHQALLDKESPRAEELLRQADALQPNAPSIIHNLAMAIEMQGRRQEAEDMLRENHAQHPDYLFSRAVLARIAIRDKKLDEARKLLEPLLHQKRFHSSEFAAFAGAQIDLLLAEGHRDGAKMWFDMWSSIDPGNPQLDYFRAQFAPLGRFLRR